MRWRKSTFSQGNGDCVELATDGEAVYVRDSKDPRGPMLRFSRPEVEAWLLGAKAGEFDDFALRHQSRASDQL